MVENTIKDIIKFCSNLKGEDSKKDLSVSNDVEDSFDTVEQIGRIALNSEEIQKTRSINIGTIFMKAFQWFQPQMCEEVNAHIDVDWFTRFIECAQDVSDEEMRLLWAKILSGELSKPNSISIMSLETLRNMSKRDAETFHKLANFAVIDDESGDVFIPQNGLVVDTKLMSDEDYGIRYDELLWMQELRLINLNMGVVVKFKKDDKSSHFVKTLKCGNLSINISAENDVSIPCYAYTRIGEQLHSLIEDITPNDAFFEDRIKNRYSSESTKITMSRE